MNALCPILVILIWLCGLNAPPGAYAAAYEIKLGFSTPETDAIGIGCQEFARYVSEHTGGKVVVLLFPRGQMGGERETIDSVRLGTLESTVTSTAALSTLDPDMRVLDIPYLFESSRVASTVLEKKLGKRLRQGFEDKTSMRIMAFSEGGYRHFSNNVRAVNVPGDLAGLKIRTLPIAAYLDTIRAMGATPHPLPLLETHAALKHGVADGQENSIGLFVSMDFQSVQRHLTLDGHMFSSLALILGGSFAKSLPEKYRTVLEDGAIVWRDAVRRVRRQQDAEGMAVIRKAGVLVVEPSQEQHMAFRNAAMPVANSIRATIAPDIIELLDGELGKARDRYGYGAMNFIRKSAMR